VKTRGVVFILSVKYLNPLKFKVFITPWGVPFRFVIDIGITTEQRAFMIIQAYSNFPQMQRNLEVANLFMSYPTCEMISIF